MTGIKAAGVLASKFGGQYGAMSQAGLELATSLISSIAMAKVNKIKKEIQRNEEFPKIACLYHFIQEKNVETGGCSKVNEKRLDVTFQMKENQKKRLAECANEKKNLGVSPDLMNLYESLKDSNKVSLDPESSESAKQTYILAMQDLSENLKIKDIATKTGKMANVRNNSHKDCGALSALSKHLLNVSNAIESKDALKIKAAMDVLENSKEPYNQGFNEGGGWYSYYLDQVLGNDDSKTKSTLLTQLAKADQKYQEVDADLKILEAQVNEISYLKRDNNTVAVNGLMLGAQKAYRKVFENKIDAEMNALKTMVKKNQEDSKTDRTENITGSVDNLVNICMSTASMFEYDAEANKGAGAWKGSMPNGCREILSCFDLPKKGSSQYQCEMIKMKSAVGGVIAGALFSGFSEQGFAPGVDTLSKLVPEAPLKESCKNRPIKPSSILGN